MDDYYLNLLSWGRNNVLAVALGGCVYLWDESTGQIQHLLSLNEQEIVTSVAWNDDNNIAVGTSANDVQLWDAKALKMVRSQWLRCCIPVPTYADWCLFIDTFS